jgi:drug/metabolite transporter (DMT)-like permease
VALALLAFLPFLRPRAVSVSVALRLVGIGALQFGLMYLAYLAAFDSLEAYQVAVLTIVTPIFVCLAADVLDLRFRWAPLFAAILAVAGSGVIVAQKPLGRAEWWGHRARAALQHLLRARAGALPPLETPQPQVRDRDVFAWLYLGAVLATAPLALLHGNPGATANAITPHQLGVIVYLGVLASGAAFFLWNLGAVRVSTSSLAVMNNAKLPLGVAVSLLVFGEKTDIARLLLGGGLILAAALYAQWLEKRGRG